MEIGIVGVLVGHWSDDAARTGCTVVRLPPGTVAAGEVRGGAPATREFALLHPGALVDHVDAVVLTGGSAFGLASADGVVAALEDDGRGFPTAVGAVPIVVAMALFDLGVGDATVRPGPDGGRAAYAAATDDPATGRVGAGTGATVGKWRGRDQARPGGLGVASVRSGDVTVAAVVAVNAAGDVVRPEADATAAVVDGSFSWPAPSDTAFTNTTIGVVVTDASLDAAGCRVLAEGAHDGLARAVVPPHMRSDGDAFVAAATGDTGAAATGDTGAAATGDAGAAATGDARAANVDEVRWLGVVAVEQAVRSAVDTLDP